MAKPPTGAEGESPAAASTTGAAPFAPPAERTLRFLRRHHQYQRGDVAGFGVPLAEQLIRTGVAVDTAPAPSILVRK